VIIESADVRTVIGSMPLRPHDRSLSDVAGHILDGGVSEVLEVDKAVNLKMRPRVDVTKFTTDGVTHYDFVLAGAPVAADYDNRRLPRYLFYGAALMTLLIGLKLTRPILRLRREGI